jgi:hypothetical protein
MARQDETFVDFDSLIVVHAPPFCDISNLKVYDVGDTSLTVTRTLVVVVPTFSSLFQFHVSPVTVPVDEMAMPMLSKAWYV